MYSFILLTIIFKCSSSEFSYEDIENWPFVDTGDMTNFCGSSNTQSPININTESAESAESIELTENGNLDWNLNFNINQFEITNNGHSLAINAVLSDNEEFGRLKNIVSSTDDYCLDHIHLHWSLDDNAGSEHKINDESFVLEMHFVHYLCNYNDINEAIIASEETEELSNPYVLAVVGVLFRIGDENEFIKIITDSIDNLIEPENEININTVNMDKLIPNTLNDFYFYKGSLTTPPCSPIVSWHIFSEILSVSEDQMISIRKIKNHFGNIGSNIRPIQDNINTVYHNYQDDDQDDAVEAFETVEAESAESIESIDSNSDTDDDSEDDAENDFEDATVPSIQSIQF